MLMRQIPVLTVQVGEDRVLPNQIHWPNVKQSVVTNFWSGLHNDTPPGMISGVSTAMAIAQIKYGFVNLELISPKNFVMGLSDAKAKRILGISQGIEIHARTKDHKLTDAHHGSIKPCSKAPGMIVIVTGKETTESGSSTKGAQKVGLPRLVAPEQKGRLSEHNPRIVLIRPNKCRKDGNKAEKNGSKRCHVSFVDLTII
jgi:hypothetical protein